MAYSQEDKANLLEILESNDFNIKKSVKDFNEKTTHSLERKSVYLWLDNDKFFKEQFDLRQKELLDEAEHSHRLLRKGIAIKDEETDEIIAWQTPPDRGAIEFFLKSKGKDRGYTDVSKTDLTTNGEKITQNIINLGEGLDPEK